MNKIAVCGTCIYKDKAKDDNPCSRCHLKVVVIPTDYQYDGRIR